VVGLTSTVMLILALPTLVAHLASIALTKALQSYSRSRLEEYCANLGKSERAAEVAHLDEPTERGAEAIAVVSGLSLAAFIGVALDRWHSPPGLELVVLLVLAVGGLGYVLAGVLGKVFAEPIVYVFWPAASFIRGTAWPLSQGAAGLEYLIERFVGNPENGPRPASVEVEISTEEGQNSQDVEAEIPEATRALLQRAVELSRTSVSEIMIPSSAIVSLPSTVTAHAAAETFRRTGRSRIPIFGANRDDIVGILIGKDLWDLMVEHEDADSVIPARIVRPAFFVPETCDAFQLIDELRGNRTQMAIVLDEYGGVAGLITLEDLLEQLVGPIDDEHDVPTPADPIKALGGSRFEVDATLPLEVLNDRFDLRLPTEEDFQTLGGLAFHALGRLPEQGATFRYDGVEFTILDLHDHSIGRVMIDLQPVASNSNGF
jgi:CBS domain containing-hemolysin-like protein